MNSRAIDNAILELNSWYDMNSKIFYAHQYWETKQYYILKDFYIYKKVGEEYSVPLLDCFGIVIETDKLYVVSHPLSPGKIALWGDVIIRQVTGDY